MALIKQNANIPFLQGLDQKADPKQLSDGKLLAVENGRFTKFGTVSKRYGTDSLSTEVLNGNDITEATNLFPYKDELLLFGASHVYSYSSGREQWVDKGQSISIATKQNPVISNNYFQSLPDVASINGFTVYAWEDSRGGVRASLYDDITGAIFLADQSISSTGICPRVVAIATYLYIFYVETNSIKWKRINTETPTTISSATTFQTDSNSTPLYNVIVYGTAMLMAYKDTSNDIILTYLTREGVEGTPINGFPAIKTIDHTPTNILNLAAFSNGVGEFISLAWKDAANGVTSVIYNRNFIEVAPATVIDSNISTMSSLTGYKGAFISSQLEVDNDCFRWYYTVFNADSTKTIIRTSALKTDGTAATPEVFKRSVGLIGEVFIQDNIAYIPTLHDSEFQATVFLMNANGIIVAKFFDVATTMAAGSLPTKPYLSRSYVSESNTTCFAAPVREKLITAANTAYTLQGIRRCELNYSAATSYNAVNIGNSMYLSGGIISSYDGVGVVESGFHLFPEGVTSIALAPSGADGLPNGTYQYQVMYSWLDNKGELQRSAPSIPITYTNASGSDKAVLLTIPTLRLTKKTSPMPEVQVEVYRTEDAGEIFYRVFDYESSYVYNDPTTDTITFRDETLDDDLISQEILYTTGGVFENDAPTSGSMVLSHQNRLFLGGTQTIDKVYYSKKYVPGQSINFSAFFSLQVNPLGGIVTALGSMDDKLIIFKRDNIYAVFGDGPVPTGESNTFSEPQLIATDVGCSNINSVAYSPAGLVFKSTKGIYLLDKGLQTQYIGAAVEDYNDADITSSQLVEDVNEVRFTTSTGTTLVYNYFFQQWSTFTNQAGVASCTWQNKYCYVDTSGKVFKENTSVFYDDDASYSLKIVTGWLKQFSGIQGFQRVYRAALIGNYKSEHRLRVKIYYDYENFPSQTIYFNPNNVLGQDSDETYGDISPYGESGSTFGGGLSNVYQFRMHLKKQQCTALKFEIEDIPDNDTASSTGESYSISNLNLEIGVKGGLSRLPRNKSL